MRFFYDLQKMTFIETLQRRFSHSPISKYISLSFCEDTALWRDNRNVEYLDEYIKKNQYRLKHFWEAAGGIPDKKLEAALDFSCVFWRRADANKPDCKS